jgi:hypothetical protein
MARGQLEEIAHTGGKVTFDVQVDADGRVEGSSVCSPILSKQSSRAVQL